MGSFDPVAPVTVTLKKACIFFRGANPYCAQVDQKLWKSVFLVHGDGDTMRLGTVRLGSGERGGVTVLF